MIPDASSPPDRPEQPQVQRLFVAVQPPPAVIERLEQLPRPAASGVRWVDAAQWHVTLRFFGRAEAGEVIDAVAATLLPPATIHLGPAVSRLGRKVVILPAAGADQLAATVRRVTTHLVSEPDPLPFAGHLTLARLTGGATTELLGTPFEATFPVTAVGLFASEPGEQGHRYTLLHSWRPRPQERSS